jgi:transcription initiation factor TFIIIB Brf1 subunit/transcription initiation factor TFIIB
MSAVKCEIDGICGIKGGGVRCEMVRFAALSPSSQILEDSEVICSWVLTKGLLKAKPAKLIAGSSFYIGCRKNLVPVTLRRLAAICGIRSKEIARGSRQMTNSLHLRLPASDTTAYVAAVLSKMEGPPQIGRQAEAISTELRPLGLGEETR